MLFVVLIQPIVGFSDLLFRWLTTLLDTGIGDRGYLTVGSVIGAYFVVFGLIDAKSTREETRAAVERSEFSSQVNAGNAASLVAGLKEFGFIQTIPVTEAPSVFAPWAWGRVHQPNKDIMWRWALWRLGLCSSVSHDCSQESDFRIDLREANLAGAKLNGADLHGADLRGAFVIDTDLQDADLRGADLRGAPAGEILLKFGALATNITNECYKCELFLMPPDEPVDFLRHAHFEGAKYDSETKFPERFDLKAQRMQKSDVR